MSTHGVDAEKIVFAARILRLAGRRFDKFNGVFEQRLLMEKLRGFFALFVGLASSPDLPPQILFQKDGHLARGISYETLPNRDFMSAAFSLDDTLQPIKDLLSQAPYSSKISADHLFDGGCLNVEGLWEVSDGEPVFRFVAMPRSVSEAMLRFSFSPVEFKDETVRATLINHASVVFSLLGERPAAMMIGQTPDLVQMIYLWSANNKLEEDLTDFLIRPWSASFINWTTFMVKQKGEVVIPQIAKVF